MPKKQVFVKRTDGQTVVLDMRLSETVDELKRKIRSQGRCSDNDVYLTFWRRVFRGNDVVGEVRCGRRQHSERDGEASRWRKASEQEEPERSRKEEGHASACHHRHIGRKS